MSIVEVGISAVVPFITEGTSADPKNGVFVEFEITRVGGLEHEVQVGYGFNNRVTAAAMTQLGQDFNFRGGTVTFKADDTTPRRVKVQLKPDSLDEFDETLNASIGLVKVWGTDSNNQRGTYTIAPGRAIASVEILDDDDPPLATLEPKRSNVAAEGATLVYLLKLDRPSGKPVDFDLSLQSWAESPTFRPGWEGDAYFDARDEVTVGQDGTEAHVTIPAGKTSLEIRIKTNNDQIVERSEDLELTARYVNIWDGVDRISSGFVLSDAAIITDNDKPSVYLRAMPGNTKAVIDEDGSAGALVQIVLGTDVERPVNVTYQTVDGTAKANVFPVDYQRVPAQTFSFDAGRKAGDTFDLQVFAIADSDPEPTEQFHVAISAAREVRVLRNRVTIEIANDDGKAGDVRTAMIAVEQQAGSAMVTIQLDRPAAQDLTIAYNFLVSSTFQVAAMEGTDFILAPNDAISGHTVKFAKGQTTVQIVVIGLTVPLPGGPPPLTGFAFTLLAGKGYKLKAGASAVDVLTNLPPIIPEE